MRLKRVKLKWMVTGLAFYPNERNKYTHRCPSITWSLSSVSKSKSKSKCLWMRVAKNQNHNKIIIANNERKRWGKVPRRMAIWSYFLYIAKSRSSVGPIDLKLLAWRWRNVSKFLYIFKAKHTHFLAQTYLAFDHIWPSVHHNMQIGFFMIRFLSLFFVLVN